MKKILLYIFTFYIIYTPNITALTGISILGIELNKHTVLIIGSIFIAIYYMAIRIKCKEKINLKTVIPLFLGIILSSVYYIVRVIPKEEITVETTRIVQNNFIILQILYIIIILDILKFWKYSKEDMVKFILNVALIQSIIGILMLIIPSFRQIAINLCFNGLNENKYIIATRIYGISDDYTFGTQIFHAFLATIAVLYGIYVNKKYYIYVPFLLIISLLNGRTGTLIFIINLIIIITTLIFTGKINKKILKYIVLGIVLLIIILQLIRIAIPKTYNFINSMITDTVNLITGDELTGNYQALFGYMLYWPEGIYFIIGEGNRVYANSDYIQSDIGYVNDMFMGGLIYIVILYGTIITFLMKKNKEDNKLQNQLNLLISLISVATLLIANYKGEAMKGRNIVIWNIIN